MGGDSEHSSGRVRFASKVDVSPTPPDSEASSVQFRIVGARPGSRRKTREGESGEDLVGAYEERRGRSRARDTARRTGGDDEGAEYFYERKEVERAPSRFGGDGHTDRSEGAYTWFREPKPLTQAVSESPSREVHGEGSAWRKSEAFGQYRPKMRQPESLDVLDGRERDQDRRGGHARGLWPGDVSIPEGHVR
ncbi:hypothetical protein LTR53_006731 [Teratosphaeriaceae sp. CCFEE 6253]|nr:hypothetical protein LTR53_006731 [Teratosphaeriaceae sp. CCFEE 6253]